MCGDDAALFRTSPSTTFNLRTFPSKLYREHSKKGAECKPCIASNQYRAPYRLNQCSFSSLVRVAVTYPSEPVEAELALGIALCWEGSAGQS